MNQNYESYTSEDFEVWEILFERQMAQLPPMATRDYLEGLEKIRFSANEIPDFNKVNPLLKSITGWQVNVVAGLIPNKEFFELMSERFFPATTWLRKREQLAYLEEPDMFHDVFGHVPLLTNQSFVNFLQELARIALVHIDNDDIIEKIARLYWYTVEFGLIREDKKLKIYGAGILSSAGESEYSLYSSVPQRVAYNVAEIMATPYIKDHYQEKYFVIDSYEQLYHSIPEIEALIERESATV
jgi:phenylalanine-4-hydroxylase